LAQSIYGIRKPNLFLQARWYLKKKRYVAAYGSLKRLRMNEIQAARDLYLIYSQLRYEELLIEKSGLAPAGNFFTRFAELFTVPRIRRATQASGIVMIGQQVSFPYPPQECPTNIV